MLKIRGKCEQRKNWSQLCIEFAFLVQMKMRESRIHCLRLYGYIVWRMRLSLSIKLHISIAHLSPENARYPDREQKKIYRNERKNCSSVRRLQKDHSDIVITFLLLFFFVLAFVRFNLNE